MLCLMSNDGHIPTLHCEDSVHTHLQDCRGGSNHLILEKVEELGVTALVVVAVRRRDRRGVLAQPAYLCNGCSRRRC